MQDLLRHGRERGNDIEHLGGPEAAMGVWLLHANFDIFHFSERFVDEFNALHLLAQVISVVLGSKNSLFEIASLVGVDLEGVLNFASVSIDFVMLSVPGWNDNLFSQPCLLLVLQRVVNIFVREHEFELFTHLIFQLIG